MLIIDPQVDFMEGGSLPVDGATDDMKRLANFIDNNELNQIYVTLDSHQPMQIFHSRFWVDESGKHPQEFTIISADDVTTGKWIPINDKEDVICYLLNLQVNDKEPLTIWPDHCIIGSPGHNIQEDLRIALYNWSYINNKPIQYVPKGTCTHREHYGAFMAELELWGDPTTYLNSDLINRLLCTDRLIIAGEASSHCVKVTVEQLVKYAGNIPEVILLSDCMSPVAAIPGGPNYPQIAETFLRNPIHKSIKVVKSTSFNC